jgi:hypothetical protein
LIVLFIVLFSGMLIWAGCQKPQVGTPGYHDPSEDRSPFQRADEFKYLVSVKDAIRNVDSLSKSVEAGESVVMSEDEVKDALESMGVKDLVEKNIISEANQSMIHARGEYTIGLEEGSVMEFLAGQGTAEVKLPAHFPKDRWATHLVLANPDKLVQKFLASLQESMQAMQGETEGGESTFGGLDFYLGLMGFEKPEDVYNWMGDELVLFSLINKDFDPQGGMTPTNTPFFGLVALGTPTPEKGLDVVENVAEFYLGMAQMQKPEGFGRFQMRSYPAFRIPPPDFANSPMGRSVPEDELSQLKKQEDIPATVAVAVPGYLIIADEPSVEAALDMFNKDAIGTGRMATIEGLGNLDLISESFNPTNISLILNMAQGGSAEIQDLMRRFYDATREIKELGTSRMGLVFPDPANLEIDTWTSRESIVFFEACQRVIKATPPEAWEKIGQAISSAIYGGLSGGGTGPAGGDGYEYSFPEGETPPMEKPGGHPGR